MAQNHRSYERVLSVAKAQIWDALITSVFFAWGYLFLLNSNPFSLITNDINLPVLFFMLLAFTMSAYFTISSLRGRGSKSLSERTLRTISYSCAAATCALFGLAIAYEIPATAIIIGASALSAVALICFARSCFIRYSDADMLSIIVDVTLSFTFGVLILLISIILLSGAGLMYCYAIMLLFCGLGIWHDRNRQSDKENDKDRDKLVSDRPQTEKLAFFKPIFFLVGLFLAYEFNGTQKTMHFIGVHVFPEQMGGTAFTSIEYLIITLVLLVVIGIAYVRSSIILPSIAAAVLLAASFFSIPTLDRLPFPLLAASGTALLFLALFFLCYALRSAANEDERTKSFGLNMALLSFGGLIGSLLALFVLTFLDTDSQAGFFTGFQAALLLIIIIVLIVYNKDIAALFRRNSPDNTLDASKLENRCSMLASRHGLTKRESEVLDFLARGRNVPSIAEELVLSKSTVKSHVIQIYRKIGVSSRQELLDIIYSEGDVF